MNMVVEYYKTVEEVEEAVNNGLWCNIEDKIYNIVKKKEYMDDAYRMIGNLNHKELQMIRKKIRSIN
jgi:uncharacterized pyridoxal phosphate-containing UPF0001 family protein